MAQVTLADLHPDPRNARRHNPRNIGMIVDALHEVGAARSIVIDEDGRILAGNATVEAAADAGIERVKVVDADGETLIAVRRSGLTDEQKARLALYDNRAAELADWDAEMLAMLKDDGVPMEGLFSDEELAEVLAGVSGHEPAEDPGPQIDKAAELQEKWGTALGQLWEIPSATLPGKAHRLICGDCTDAAVVERVMGGERAQLTVTSPPYAVGKEYEAGVSFAEHLALLRGFADRTIEVMVSGGFIFTNFGEIAAQSHTKPLTGSDRQCLYPISKDYWQIFHEERGCDLYAQRIWYKPFNRLQQPFWTYHTSIPHHQEWEHLWTWRMPGGEGDQVYDWDISVHAVWDTRNEATEDYPLTRHVAAFPVCLPERAIRAHSAEDNIVLDPFLGSGTTMVAAEQLGRRCYGVEIEPKYVAVALERMAGMGLEPRLVECV